VFLLTISIGVVMAYHAPKRGFVGMWALLFQTLVSIYGSVMLSPTLIGYISGLQTSRYYYALCVFLVALVIFLIIHKLVVTYLPDIFGVMVPKFFEGIGARVLGFFVGFLVATFCFFLLAVMPLSRNTIISETILNQVSLEQVNTRILLANSVVSKLSLQFVPPDKPDCRNVVEWLTWGGYDSEPGETDSAGGTEAVPGGKPPLFYDLDPRGNND